MSSTLPKWTVTVESMPGLTKSSEHLNALRKSLAADPWILGPTTDLNPEQGVLSATFQVDAHPQGRACEIAIDAFYSGLESAGFETQKPGWRLRLEIAPSAEATDASARDD